MSWVCTVQRQLHFTTTDSKNAKNPQDWSTPQIMSIKDSLLDKSLMICTDMNIYVEILTSLLISKCHKHNMMMMYKA